jgi:hypothetical protein
MKVRKTISLSFIFNDFNSILLLRRTKVELSK